MTLAKRAPDGAHSMTDAEKDTLVKEICGAVKEALPNPVAWIMALRMIGDEAGQDPAQWLPLTGASTLAEVASALVCYSSVNGASVSQIERAAEKAINALQDDDSPAPDSE